MIEMKKLILMFIVFFTFTGCTTITNNLQGDGCIEWDNSNTTDPFKLLARSRCFRLGGVGYTGEIAPEHIALCKLMKKENASDVLEELYVKGRTAGKLYALVGLHVIDKTKCNQFVPELIDDTSMVDTQSGCIIHQLKVNDVVESIKGGIYDEEILRELENQE